MDNDNNFIKTLLILENVKLNIKIVNNLKNHFDTLLSNNIIFSNKYDDIIDKLKFLNSELNSQLKTLVIIQRIYLLNEIDNNLIDVNDEDTTNKINLLDSASKIIKDEIIKLIQEYGYYSIHEILSIIDNSLYERNKLALFDKIDILEKFFQPIKVNKENLDFGETINVKIKNIPIEKIKKLPCLSKNEKNIFGGFDGSVSDSENLKINIIYELNKAIIEIEIENHLFIIDGYFKEDIFNELYNISQFEFKYKNIIKKLINTDNKEKNEKNIDKNKLKAFTKQCLNQFSTRDFIVLEEDELVDKIKEMYDMYNSISKTSILDLLDKFAKIDLYSKRELIILLLIDDNDIDTLVEDIFENEDEENNKSKSDYKNSVIVFNKNFNIENMKKDNIIENDNENDNENKSDNISKKIPITKVKLNKTTATRYSINSIMKNFDTKNEIKNLTCIISNSKKILNANVLLDFLRNSILKSIEYDNFKNSIHWSLRKKIFARPVNDYKTNNSEEISWETKLSVMDITEKAKDKVNEKIKEANSSKENVKAITFIESFFKIPFGKFIREDIFVKTEKSNIKIKELINKINKFIIMDKDKIHISDSLEQINQKTIEYRLLNDIESIYKDLIDEKYKINKEKKIYMEKVNEILNHAVYGHNESKREIKRLIAQWMSGKMEGIILGFHGPPGVGKTCFAKKGISKCLFDSEGNPRPFCIFQLGGATDGSILEGHSYTYIGSKPGRLVEFLQETKCMNPIIYFDELDKVSETEKGKEIIDILIHLTDKSQNKELFDKYFSGIELDFSKCIIIFSYNDASKVNRILRDRITEIKINPLKKNEKIHITKNYTFKEIAEELNFNCEMSDELIEYIIDTYTFESGVRKLNEKFYQIFREINLRILEDPYSNIEINKDLVDEILTRHYKIKHHKIHSEPKVGLVNGLYASTVGLGGITLIQVKKILTTSNNIPLELTGQQGNVMKESMSCAKTLALNLLSNEEKEYITTELKTHPFGLHIHCPDGSTPKDGPSAGITITTGIYSILTNKKIQNDIAMTGEVDLLGNVKAIGGLDAKINGAIKAGVKLVIFPKENEQDWEKIIKDKSLDGEIEIYMVETIEQVIDKVIYLENNH
jgi:ATP-dependent Lon protease